MESGERTFFIFYKRFLSDYEKKVGRGLRVNGTRTKYKILLKYLLSVASVRLSSLLPTKPWDKNNDGQIMRYR
jgi:hypothetical protein